jgi:hypothetical protein
MPHTPPEPPKYRATDLPFPPHWINAYLYDKLGEYKDIGIDSRQQLVPIFAMTPTSTEEIYRNVLQSSTVEQPLIIQYDRLMRFRPTPFYGRKREQLMYYLYSTSIANVNNANIVISQLLDREDAAAQDVNDWARIHSGGLNKPHNVYFHNIRVYQADETRDLVDLASARTVFINKLIIEYDYHPVWVDKEYQLDENGKPEPDENGKLIVLNPEEEQERFK